MPRYVVLEHETPPGYPRGRHWDFMLERREALATWALPTAPDESIEAEVEQLGDHRLAYLELEGEIAGGRGSVTRWDEGTYSIVVEDDERIVVRVMGSRLRGEVEFSRAPRTFTAGQASSTELAAGSSGTEGAAQRWRFSFRADRSDLDFD